MDHQVDELTEKNKYICEREGFLFCIIIDIHVLKLIIFNCGFSIKVTCGFMQQENNVRTLFKLENNIQIIKVLSFSINGRVVTWN